MHVITRERICRFKGRSKLPMQLQFDLIANGTEGDAGTIENRRTIADKPAKYKVILSGNSSLIDL
jgi:hypothetical protein